MRFFIVLLAICWLVGLPIMLFLVWFFEVGRAATWPWEACLIPWGLTILFGCLFGLPEDDKDPS